jgi:hypothetical protein
MDDSNNDARRMKSIRRASFFASWICLVSGSVWAAYDEYRVAAIIATDSKSMVLIQIEDGEQSWYNIGDVLGDSRVEHIDPEWISIANADGEVRLYLRDDHKVVPASANSEPVNPPPREVSRNYKFVNLISRVDSATTKPGESSEQAVGRKLNEVFGLAETARIISVGDMQVSSAIEARDALSNQLRQGEPIRVKIDNAYTRMLYVTPEQ